MLPFFVLVVVCAPIVFGAAGKDLQNENIFMDCSPYTKCLGIDHWRCEYFCECQGYGHGGKCEIFQKAPAPECEYWANLMKQQMAAHICV